MSTVVCWFQRTLKQLEREQTDTHTDTRTHTTTTVTLAHARRGLITAYVYKQVKTHQCGHTLVDAVATIVPLAERERAVRSWEWVVHTLSLTPCPPLSSLCSSRHIRSCTYITSRSWILTFNSNDITYLEQYCPSLPCWIHHYLIVYTSAYLP